MAEQDIDLRKHVDRRRGALDNARSSYLPHWRDLSDYIQPRRGRYLLTTNESNKGGQRNQRILDPTGTFALRTLSSGMMAGLTSPARPWLRLTIEDRDLAEFAPVRRWLDEVRKRILTVFAKSNLYNTLPLIYEELGLFGTGCVYIDEDFEDIIRCYPLTAGEYYLGTGPRLNVDTLYRDLLMTVDQLVRKFGFEACSSTVQGMYQRGQLDTEIEIVHAIEPNPKARPKAMRGDGDWISTFKQDAAWRSVYFERAAGPDAKLLDVDGIEEQAFMAPRWDVSGNDLYGRSPGMDALPAVMGLQVMEKRRQQGIEKMVNPPMVAPVSLQNQPASVLPGGVTFVASGDPGMFKPAYQVDPKLGDLRLSIIDRQEEIKQAFYADLFLMLANSDRREITAREIDERHEEKMLMLGPVIERTHNELLDPIVDRTFAILQRKGLLPQAPPELAGEDIRVEYISLLAQAQKAVATAGIERLVAFAGNLAAVKPDIIDKVDLDQAIDEYGDMLGVSPKVIVSDEDVAAIRQGRAQQAAQMQQAETAMAAAQGAKVLSETEVGGGRNALQQMIGAV